MFEQRLTPGLMVIHGNHLEALRDLLVQWLSLHPLGVLENEIFLVQSNGIAQWLKLALARDVEQGGCGVAAALEVQLPAQFLWRAYRAALGHEAIPEVSSLDKGPLTWRIMGLLPSLLEQPESAALRVFLADDGDLRKRHQLAERLADLFDQYQVYRADWLEDWEQGLQQLRLAKGQCVPLSHENLWQAGLWRAVLAAVGSAGLASSRVGVHRRFMQRLREASSLPPGLPRRVVVFGISAMPAQSLEALAALAQHAQVLLCVHNPCRHHWADIVADKDLLRHQYRRHGRRAGTPELLDDDQRHQYAHPLLAAWGKQGRDYINLLDQYDNPDSYRERLGAVSNGRIDLFSEEQPHSLLGQLQDDILQLRPLAESRAHWPALDPAKDQSIRFHIAHSAQREVEILHDQLLARFDADPQLRPRDVIVMLPDINAYAPHINAVFGQLSRDERRGIPYTLADQGQRGREPLLAALEQLLRLPDSRFAVSQILDLLDVAALRQRFALTDTDLPLLRRWIHGAGVRWGLDGAQRRRLDLPDAEANTWRFGLRRMLLGFAVGEGQAFQGIQPYPEIGGLDAVALGGLARLLMTLEETSQKLTEVRSPEDWGLLLRALLEDFFQVSDDHEELLRQQLLSLLEDWLQTCALADFQEPLPISVVREAWLSGLDKGGLNQRFLAGAVSFCTLMPMRAIPFQLVCLLGMNDGDYPRRHIPLGFDLMRKDYRPGDRSRREDDRYLLLEALLSARSQLYISWVGRSIRDNTERPPSVLIAQLRDHLAAAWRCVDGDLLQALTQEHPLQPFSRSYFNLSAEPSGLDGLYTYAEEWRAVHTASPPLQIKQPLPSPQLERPLELHKLAEFLAYPVAAFFKQRLQVHFNQAPLSGQDLEPFALDGLQSWQLREEICRRLRPWVETEWQEERLDDCLQAQLECFRGAGCLPLGAFGEFSAKRLVQPLSDLLRRYREALQDWPLAEEAQELQYSHAQVPLSGWLTACRRNAAGHRACVQLISGKLHKGRGLRWPALVQHWVRHLALQLCGAPAASLLVSLTGTLYWPALPRERAAFELDNLLEAWLEGMCQPLPLACETAFAWLTAAPDQAPRDAKHCYEGAWREDNQGRELGELNQSPALARVYGDFASLNANGDFARWAERLYGPLLRFVMRGSA